MRSEGGVVQEDDELSTGACRLLIEDPQERAYSSAGIVKQKMFYARATFTCS